MKFGRQEHLSQITHDQMRLPVEAKSNIFVLQAADKIESSRLSVGLPVWAQRGFVGSLYPKATPQKNYLSFYSQVFNSIELNSSFYSLPSTERVELWKKSVPEDFLFYAKAPREVGHEIGSAQSLRALHGFSEFLEHLEGNRGTAFIQFPESFGPSRLSDLISLLSQLPKAFRFAIELRHPQWFTQPKLWSRLCKTLHYHHVGLVMTDALGRRDVCHMQLTVPFSLIRFQANTLHQSDFDRLKEWVGQIKVWMDSGIHDVGFFLHQPHEPDCIPLAKFLQSHWPDAIRMTEPSKQLELV